MGDGETCRRCGYDLRGRPGDASVCPECGALLAAPGVIFRGTRRRRRGWIAVGLLAFLLGGTAIGLDGRGLLTARTLDRLTPTAYLLWQIEHRGSAGNVDRMLARGRDEPSRVDASQRLALLTWLVGAQGDGSMPWSEGWSDAIDGAFRDGSLPATLADAYFARTSNEWPTLSP